MRDESVLLPLYLIDFLPRVARVDWLEFDDLLLKLAVLPSCATVCCFSCRLRLLELSLPEKCMDYERQCNCHIFDVLESRFLLKFEYIQRWYKDKHSE